MNDMTQRIGRYDKRNMVDLEDRFTRWNTIEITVNDKVKKIHQHNCGFSVCPSCHVNVNLNFHKCCIPVPRSTDPNPDKSRYRFFDFETQVIGEDKTHVVHLAVTQDVTGRTWVQYNMQNFLEFAFSKENSNTIWFAHNGGKFDTNIILENALNHHNLAPALCRNRRSNSVHEMQRNRVL